MKRDGVDAKRAKELLVAAYSEQLINVEQLAEALVRAGQMDATGEHDFQDLLTSSLDISVEKLGQLAALVSNYTAENPVVGAAEHRSNQLREAYDTERLTAIGEVDRDVLNDTAQRYVVGQELGRGGAGFVTMAWDKHLRRVVAMKQPLPASPTAAIDRFLEEAQTTGGLEHPSIVPVYDLGVMSDGQIFYTMKYIRRQSLREVIEAHCKGAEDVRKEYGLYKMLTVLQQVCMAIHYAHVKGVLHRDLKPDNIMVGEYGEVFVMDWGLALVREGGVLEPPPDEVVAVEDESISGTPEYMAPEQARADYKNVWAATDVFSLGAILYEMLTLHPPYRGKNQLATLMQALKCQIEPPQKRAPYRSIPADLEAICLKALNKDPRDRYASAKELHDELDAFVQGRKETERQNREAESLVRDGDHYSQRYFSLRKKAQQERRKARTRAQELKGHDPIDEKRKVWEAVDGAEKSELDAIQLFSSAESAYFGALAHVSEKTEARLGLASLYYSRFQRAESQRDPLETLYFKNRLKEFDDGAYSALIDAKGRVVIRCETEKASVKLCRYEEKDRALVPRLVETLEVSSATLDLEPGSYVLETSAPGFASSNLPFVVERGQSQTLRVQCLESTRVADNFVFVPRGIAELGGDNLAPNSAASGRIDVGPYCLGQYPITFGEYIEFLDDLSAKDHAAAIGHIPRTAGDGMLCIHHADGSFRPSDRLIEGSARTRYPKGQGHEYFLPVYGVDWYDAVAYAQWRSQREGRNYRLPTEIEWEKAARGVDGRYFPWGSTFDAGFCSMYDSRPDMCQPEPVGVFETDLSPYGVRDMAGGIREWAADIYGADAKNGPSQRVVRGGAWGLTEHFSRAATRYHMLDRHRNPVVGFRLAHDI